MSIHLKRTSLITVMGSRGSGKTVLSQALLKLWPNLLESKLYIFDPMDSFTYIDIEVCHTLEDCTDFFLAGGQHIRLASSTIQDGLLMFEVLRELDNIITVIDEADMLLRAQHNPEAFLWICDYGRHSTQGGIFCARRPARLPRDFTAQSILFYSNVREGRDRQYLKERLDMRPLPLPGEYCWYAHDLNGELTYFDKGEIMQILRGQTISAGGS